MLPNQYGTPEKHTPNVLFTCYFQEGGLPVFFQFCECRHGDGEVVLLKPPWAELRVRGGITRAACVHPHLEDAWRPSLWGDDGSGCRFRNPSRGKHCSGSFIHVRGCLFWNICVVVVCLCGLGGNRSYDIQNLCSVLKHFCC